MRLGERGQARRALFCKEILYQISLERGQIGEESLRELGLCCSPVFVNICIDTQR
jgi:hypothetical protein